MGKGIFLFKKQIMVGGDCTALSPNTIFVIETFPTSLFYHCIFQVRAVLFPPPKEEDFVWTVMVCRSFLHFLQ